MAGEDREFREGARVPGTNYVVIRRESGGGHGTLYRVRHHRIERRIFALKILHADLRNNAELAKRMEREAQIVGAMNHPNIVTVFDAGTTEEVGPGGEGRPRPFLAMEWLKGRSLAQILSGVRNSGIGLQAALEIAIDLVDALEYAHTRHGVVHRDIKPDNIFLQVVPTERSTRTVTKLLDFGVARVLGADRVTQRGMVLGTPRYAAPEQLRGEPVIPQTDFYALGLVLHEMLVGYGPFDHHRSFAEMTRAHLLESPAPLPAEPLPKALVALVSNLLDKDPEKRPRSAAELSSVLRGAWVEAERMRDRALADLSRTDPSPVQNVLAQASGEATDPGPPPDVRGNQDVTSPAAPAARHLVEDGKTDPGMGEPPPDVRGHTLEEAGPPVARTLRLAPSPQPTVVPVSEPSRPRADPLAETHSLEPEPPLGVKRTDTEPIPPGELAGLSVPEADGGRFKVVGDRVVFLVDDEEVEGTSGTPATLSTGGTAALASDVTPARLSSVRRTEGVLRRSAVARYAVGGLAVLGAAVVAMLLLSSRHRMPPTTAASSAPSVLTAPAASETVTSPIAAESVITSAPSTTPSDSARESGPAPPSSARLAATRERPTATPHAIQPPPRPSPSIDNAASEGFKTTFQ
jgi:serine/threonine-protein kinase